MDVHKALTGVRSTAIIPALMLTRCSVPFDPWQFVAVGGEVLERIPMQALERLLDLLAYPGEDIIVAMKGIRDEHSRPRLVGRIQATLPTTCQRCLGPMSVTLDVPMDLVLVRAGTAVTANDESGDAVEVPDAGLVLTELVCDELLLAMPIAPAHAELAECRANGYRAPESAPREDHPFAALSDLVKRR